MNEKLKKIIAREGLIFLGIFTFSLFIYKLGSFVSDYVKGDIFDKAAVQLSYERIAYFLYPFYLIIRFILWAIKTLKKN